MDRILQLLVCAAVIVCGCHRTDEPANPASTQAAASRQRQSLTLRVTRANEHLGHSTAEGDSNVHPVWCDGCRGRLAGTDEEFMIWWNNNELESTPFRFEDGMTYGIQFEGELEDAVMGYEGKCVHISKIRAAVPREHR